MVGALIPTRGDRPNFLNFSLNQLNRQTKRVDLIEVVDDPPKDANVKDITFRYRIGMERLFGKGADVIFLWEDDDYYSPVYVETMLHHWTLHQKPDIFGINFTVYYHLRLRSYFRMNHPNRSSAFCTMVTRRGISNFTWPNDNHSFVDIDLWRQIRGFAFVPNSVLALGIKGYNEGGHFGGIGHNDKWPAYSKNGDGDLGWLKSVVDQESLDFYRNFM